MQGRGGEAYSKCLWGGEALPDAKRPGLGEGSVKTMGAAGRELRERRKVVAKMTHSHYYYHGERSDNKCHWLFHYKCAETLVNRNLRWEKVQISWFYCIRQEKREPQNVCPFGTTLWTFKRLANDKNWKYLLVVYLNWGWFCPHVDSWHCLETLETSETTWDNCHNLRRRC